MEPNTGLNVLMIEDSPSDEFILYRQLHRHYKPLNLRRVETIDALKQMLTLPWDIIIADYNLPGWTALDALNIIKYENDTPVIILSGAIGEETAVAAMRAGAVDYLMKDKTDRLLPAIARELRDARTRRDLHAAQLALERAKRLETVGVLAGAVAHDLNNILSPLVAYPDLILNLLPTETPARDYIHQMQFAANRAAAVIQDLLTLSARPTYTKTTVNLNALIAEFAHSATYTELQQTYPHIQFTYQDTAIIPPVLGSATHLYKVILNLTINAFEANHRPPPARPHQITLATACTYVAYTSTLYDAIPAGEYVTLTVHDTGPGIPLEDVPHIFEPFFTKKKDHRRRIGSGLGLTIVHNIVRDHDGKIGLTTSPQGTTFTIYLPITQSVPPPPPPTTTPSDQLPRAKSHETILVVDDEPTQRTVIKTMLTALGYHVITAEHGHAALDHLATYPADLVILDMLMEPHYDGLDTYQDIIKIKPGQKAIISSGFSESTRVAAALNLGVGYFLKKPYTISALAHAVRQELDKNANLIQTKL